MRGLPLTYVQKRIVAGWSWEVHFWRPQSWPNPSIEEMSAGFHIAWLIHGTTKLSRLSNWVEFSFFLCVRASAHACRMGRAGGLRAVREGGREIDHKVGFTGQVIPWLEMVELDLSQKFHVICKKFHVHGLRDWMCMCAHAHVHIVRVGGGAGA